MTANLLADGILATGTRAGRSDGLARTWLDRERMVTGLMMAWTRTKPTALSRSKSARA